MKIKNIILILAMCVSLNAGDIMVERMQSVVNEVSELRERYEDAVQKNEQCLSQLKDKPQASHDLSSSSDKARIEALEFENMKLKEAHDTAKFQNKQLLKLQAELEISQKEQKRLNASALILVEKNHSLLAQITKLKHANDEVVVNELVASNKQLQKRLQERETQAQKLEKENSSLQEKLSHEEGEDKKALVLRVQDTEDENKRLKEEVAAKVLVIKALNTKALADTSPSSSDLSTSKEYTSLQKDNISLREALQSCNTRHTRKTEDVKKLSKGICIDDNPFPKLMPKQKPKKIKPVEKKKVTASSTKLPGVFRIKGESAIYDQLNGKVVEVWEDTRSFTSNVYEDKWVKITGYFVNRKWQKSKNELWVKRENTLRR